MTVAVCPGSFDPVTNGHLDVISRAAACFDELVVAVLINERKQTLFTLEERISFLEKAMAGIEGVRVAWFSGLLVDFCRDQSAGVIVKGLRGAGDFEYELPMARMNRHLSGDTRPHGSWQDRISCHEPCPDGDQQLRATYGYCKYRALWTWLRAVWPRTVILRILCAQAEPWN